MWKPSRNRKRAARIEPSGGFARLRFMTPGYHIIINGHSGTALKLGQDAILKTIEDSGLPTSDVRFVEPEGMQTALAESRDIQAPLLLAGGDGTIMKAVMPLLRSKKEVGFIPMGTMNLLAQDLNIPVGLEAACAAYARGAETVDIDVAMVNDIPFLCAAGLGLMPEASMFREENRGQVPDILLLPRLTAFVFDRLDHTKRRTYRLLMEGRRNRIRTTSLVISNNRFATPDNAILANGFKKETLQDGLLGIYTASPKTLWDRVRLLLRLRTGGWRKDPVIGEYEVPEVTVMTHNAEEIITLDGELFTVPTPLNFKIMKQGMTVIVPKPEEPQEEAAA